MRPEEEINLHGSHHERRKWEEGENRNACLLSRRRLSLTKGRPDVVKGYILDAPTVSVKKRKKKGSVCPSSKRLTL